MNKMMLGIGVVGMLAGILTLHVKEVRRNKALENGEAPGVMSCFNGLRHSLGNFMTDYNPMRLLPGLVVLGGAGLVVYSLL